ncbi:HET-domain-containing protein, partial [Corynespora cassiicola Philippines]
MRSSGHRCANYGPRGALPRHQRNARISVIQSPRRHHFIMAYSYERLDTHRNIRILLLAPSVDHSSPLCFTFEDIDIINADDQYEAISYVWGVPLFSHRIYQNDDLDQFLRITKSLHDALTRFRHPTMTRRLWADGICINQADDAEKASQIPLMRQIYQRASKVLVWLGEGSAESSAIFNHISRISRQSSPEVGDIPEETWQAFSSFLDIPYFSRRWIVQEMALNLDVILSCGKREMTWVRLCTALDKLLRLGDKHKDHVVGYGRLEQIHHLWKYWTFDGSSDQETEMLSLLNNLDHCLCSDERDIIYAI